MRHLKILVIVLGRWEIPTKVLPLFISTLGTDDLFLLHHVYKFNETNSLPVIADCFQL